MNTSSVQANAKEVQPAIANRQAERLTDEQRMNLGRLSGPEILESGEQAMGESKIMTPASIPLKTDESVHCVADITRLERPNGNSQRMLD